MALNYPIATCTPGVNPADDFFSFALDELARRPYCIDMNAAAALRRIARWTAPLSVLVATVATCQDTSNYPVLLCAAGTYAALRTTVRR